MSTQPAFDHSGSSFDSFLEEEGILDEVEAVAIERCICEFQQSSEEWRGRSMDPRELNSHISNLSNRAPITVELKDALQEVGCIEPIDHGRFSPKKSWLGWLDGYNGPGYHNRKDWNRTAEFVYNHLNAPLMALWLGEVSGVPKPVVRKAMAAARLAHPNFGTQTAAIRKIIPWKMIEDRLGVVTKKISGKQG